MGNTINVNVGLSHLFTQQHCQTQYSEVSNTGNWMLLDPFCGKAGTQLPWMPHTKLFTGSAATRHTSGCPVQVKLWWISRKWQVVLLGECTYSVIGWSRHANGSSWGIWWHQFQLPYQTAFSSATYLTMAVLIVVAHVAIWKSSAWQPHLNNP